MIPTFQSHSQQRECDFSDHPVSVVLGVGVKLFTFSTSSPKPLNGFASNLVYLFLGQTPTKFVKIGALPLFLKELWVILCNFWPILKKSSSHKPLVRNLSNLVWRVPRVPSFQFVQIRSLRPTFGILWYEHHKTHFRLLLMNHCIDFNEN